MTNEEIRLNRYCKHCRSYDNGCDWLCRGMICQAADAYEMALDEKDRQFKEYLEKKRDNYMKQREMWHQDTLEFCCYDSQMDTIEEIINELFKEE